LCLDFYLILFHFRRPWKS